MSLPFRTGCLFHHFSLLSSANMFICILVLPTLFCSSDDLTVPPAHLARPALRLSDMIHPNLSP